MSKETKHRVICPICGKPFDKRVEGFHDDHNRLICADCYHTTEEVKDSIKKNHSGLKYYSKVFREIKW